MHLPNKINTHLLSIPSDCLVVAAAAFFLAMTCWRASHVSCRILDTACISIFFGDIFSSAPVLEYLQITISFYMVYHSMTLEMISILSQVCNSMYMCNQHKAQASIKAIHTFLRTYEHHRIWDNKITQQMLVGLNQVHFNCLTRYLYYYIISPFVKFTISQCKLCVIDRECSALKSKSTLFICAMHKSLNEICKSATFYKLRTFDTHYVCGWNLCA